MRLDVAAKTMLIVIDNNPTFSSALAALVSDRIPVVACAVGPGQNKGGWSSDTPLTRRWKMECSDARNLLHANSTCYRIHSKLAALRGEETGTVPYDGEP